VLRILRDNAGIALPIDSAILNSRNPEKPRLLQKRATLGSLTPTRRASAAMDMPTISDGLARTADATPASDGESDRLAISTRASREA